MDFYIKNKRVLIKMSLSGIKPLHVTYYGWHDLPISLWIINECLNFILSTTFAIDCSILYSPDLLQTRLCEYTRYGRRIFLIIAIQKKSEIAFESDLNISFRASTKVPFTWDRNEMKPGSFRRIIYDICLHETGDENNSDRYQVIPPAGPSRLT
jgi:hypothetical protein